MSETHEFFAAAIPGTERVLCDELRELGFSSVRLNNGGIPFRGTREDGWRACLESRIAQRIQILLHRFHAPTQDELYNAVMSIDWSPYISYKQTISVSAVCKASQINHSGFAALKTKDAIVDQIRGVCGKRPSVDKDDADVRVFLYIIKDKAAIYLDVSGDSLHRRGYRKGTGEAPLRETLASAILRMSGWDKRMPLIDPMCGSGTIAIEAAQWATNHAPGLERERFGFERWAGFDESAALHMRELRGKLRGAISGQPSRISAGDVDLDMLERAKINARAAGVRLSFKHRSVLDMQGADTRTMLVTNPPYGVRLGVDESFCRQVTTSFSRLHGWRVAFLAGTREYERTMSAKPVLKVPMKNGDIDCDFLVYEVE